MWPLALLLLVNFAVLSACLAAETTNTADDYFHHGAQDYIFGDKKAAMTQIVTGLQQYPTDPKLNGVIKLLRRLEQKSAPSKKPSDNSEKRKDDKQNVQQGQKGKQGQQDKDDKESKNNKGDKDKDKDKDKQQQQQEAKANPSDKRDQNPENQEGMSQGTMSPEEARQLLDAQQENEKVLIFAPSNQPVSTLSAKVKDW